MNASGWDEAESRLILNTGQYRFTVNERSEVVYGIGAVKG